MTADSNNVKKNIKVVGLLLLFRFIAGISGLFLENISNDLQEVSKHILSIKISIVLDFITYTVAIVTAVLLFPILKPYSHKSALWFLVFSAIGFVIMLQANVNVYTVTKLSQDFTSGQAINNSLYNTIAESRQYDSKVNHFFSLIIHSLAALAFYITLYRKKLVPRFISVFAIIAAVLVIINVMLLIFDIKSSMLAFLPNAIVQVLLGSWLVCKGFNAITSDKIRLSSE